ncbi:MAG TPA: BON domain-containing protein [Bryobacteraceae bacterium]|nr:BON domain-containing protein [Bryobacteraceae bacterium]
MKQNRNGWAVAALLFAGVLGGCAAQPELPPDVRGPIADAMTRAHFNDVKVSQDRNRGVVTLSGKVQSHTEKLEAETVARALAGTQVVANEIAVLPPGVESDTKRLLSELDKGIESNLKAGLIQYNFENGIKYDSRNGVVTLRGDVDTQMKRNQIQTLAAAIPHVQQVVNELQVKNQKASSSR